MVLTGIPNYPKGEFYNGYSLFGPYREIIDNVEIFRVPVFSRGCKKGLRLILNYISFAIIASLLSPFLLRKVRFDKIFVYQPSPVTVAFPALALKFLRKKPVFLWITDLWPDTLVTTGVVKQGSAHYLLWDKIVRFINAKTDHILVASQGYIKRLASCGVFEGKIHYWPQWAEDVFSNQPIEKNPTIDSIFPDGFVVLFAGNIGTNQAFETIIDTAEILKSYKEIKFVILGDGLARQWVENQKSERELMNLILLGSFPLGDMPYFYSKASVLLASLKADPLFSITVPAKVQSYLASGKAIIASMNGEGAQVIVEANAGIASPAGNAKQLADSVLTLFNLPSEELEKMGTNGKIYFQNNFAKSKLICELTRIMELEN